MSDLPTLGDNWAAKAASYLLAMAVAAITALWARKADVGRMATERWDSLAARLEDRCTRAEARCDAAEARCDAAERAHDVCRDELAEVRAEIGLLMSGQVETYPHKPGARE